MANQSIAGGARRKGSKKSSRRSKSMRGGRKVSRKASRKVSKKVARKRSKKSQRGGNNKSTMRGGYDFKIGDRVKRIGTGFPYPSPKYDKYDKPDDSGQGFGLEGYILHISSEGEWPPSSGRILPKLYFVQFDGMGGGIGVIEEQLMLVQKDAFNRGDRVLVKSFGSESKKGTIVEPWKGSALEKSTGQYGLNKYNVKFDDGNSGWFYDVDIQKSAN